MYSIDEFGRFCAIAISGREHLSGSTFRTCRTVCDCLMVLGVLSVLVTIRDNTVCDLLIDAALLISAYSYLLESE